VVVERFDEPQAFTAGSSKFDPLLIGDLCPAS